MQMLLNNIRFKGTSVYINNKSKQVQKKDKRVTCYQLVSRSRSAIYTMRNKRLKYENTIGGS